MGTTNKSGVILIAEDCDEDFETAQEALQKAGMPHRLERAQTGDEFLQQLLGAHAVQPDIVLMDLNMPGVDGREVLREIKTNPSLKSIPVLVLTTSANPRDLAFCYESGANAYHVKPVHYPEYLDLLETIFRYWLKYTMPWKTAN